MEKREEKRKRKADLARVRTDSARDMRAVKHFEHPYMLEGCPIQPIESYILADRDSWGIYAELKFKNLSEQPLKRLCVRLDFYYYQNIPYTSIFFEYCERDLTFGKIYVGSEPIKASEALKRNSVLCGEIFGEGVYIPLPESSYNNIAFYITEIELENGEIVLRDIPLSGRGKIFSELDEVTRRILRREKSFARSESVFPTKNLPVFSNSGWLCCCGYKNLRDSEVCEKCLRPRELQKELISESAIIERKKELANTPTAIHYHDKSRFAQNKFLQNQADKERREAEIKRSKENLLRQEEEKRRKYSHWLKRGLIFCIVAYMLTVGAVLLAVFRDGGRDTQSTGYMFKRIFEGDTSVFEFFGFAKEEDGPNSIFAVWDIFDSFDYD